MPAKITAIKKIVRQRRFVLELRVAILSCGSLFRCEPQLFVSVLHEKAIALKVINSRPQWLLH